MNTDFRVVIDHGTSVSVTAATFHPDGGILTFRDIDGKVIREFGIDCWIRMDELERREGGGWFVKASYHNTWRA